jgi:hypothetical protein
MSNRPSYGEQMGRAFDEMRGHLREVLSPSDYARLRDTFVFHMTDWESDLEALARVASDPGGAPKDESYDAVFGFLYHVLNHLRAAARLVGAEGADPFAEDEAYEILARAERHAATDGRGPKATT